MAHLTEVNKQGEWFSLMRVQVLVATMNQQDYSLLKKMNIQSEIIVGNQAMSNHVEDFMWGGYSVKWLTFNERGVGLNRNNALLRATGDICLFADDDMVYVDNYPQIVCKAFEQLPDADVIVFNLKEPIVTRYVNKKITRVRFHNYLRYGTARIAVKLKSIRENGIFFNLCYGGGTEHCHGEDNLFLTDCLKKGLKVYASPEYIAELTEERCSTWKDNISVNDYLKDQGYLYKQISPRMWRILCFQDALRHQGEYNTSFMSAYKMMTK